MAEAARDLNKLAYAVPEAAAVTEATLFVRARLNARFHKFVQHHTARLLVNQLAEILAGRCDANGDALPDAPTLDDGGPCTSIADDPK